MLSKYLQSKMPPELTREYEDWFNPARQILRFDTPSLTTFTKLAQFRNLTEIVRPVGWALTLADGQRLQATWPLTDHAFSARQQAETWARMGVVVLLAWPQLNYHCRKTRR
jgi:hypothetical protein